VLNSKCNVKTQNISFTATTSLLAAEPGAQPALCLCCILGDLTVEPVNGCVEVLAGLASVLLAPCLGLVPLLLCLNAEGVVLGLSLSAVLLSLLLSLAADLLGLVLCLLSVCPQIGLSLLSLSTGTVGLFCVSEVQVQVEVVESR
jgi:hypothetical protein